MMLAGDIESILSVSPIQAAQLSPDFGEIPVAICAQLILDLQGGLDPRALSASCQEVVKRYPVLRTSLVWKSVERPMLIIHRNSELQLFSHDLSKLSLERRPVEIKAFLEADRATAFDRATPPLARLTLFKLDANSFRLLFSYDPVVMDAWSAASILRRLLNGVYDSGSRNGFESYLSWVRRQDETTVKEYWRNALTSFRPAAPHDLAWIGRGATSNKGVSTLSALKIRPLPDTLSAELCRTAKGRRLSYGLLLWAAWALYLNSFQRRTDLVVGASLPVYPHDLDAIGSAIGPLTNIVPVRTEIIPVKPAISWLRELQLQYDAARNFAHVPLSTIQAWAGPSESAPLFDSVISFEERGIETNPITAEALALQSASLQLIEQSPAALSLALQNGLVLAARYDTDGIAHDQVESLLDQVAFLLEAVVTGIDKPIGFIQSAFKNELVRNLRAFNQTSACYPSRRLIHELYEQEAARIPDRVAVTYQDHHLTYSALNRRANQLAHYLRRQGIRSDTPVGLCLDRSVEMVVGILGILKAGGMYAPLDPSFPLERLTFLLQDSQVSLILTEDASIDALPAVWGHALSLDGEWKKVSHESEANPDLAGDPDQLCYLMYTSGSAGKPKGVGVVHRGVVRLVKEISYAKLDKETVMLQMAPISFDASTFELWGSLLNGGRLVILERGIRQPKELSDSLIRFGVNTLWLPAGLFHLLAEQETEALRGIEQLLAGGDVLSPAAVERILQEGTRLRLINGYGPTESTVFACCHQLPAGWRGSRVPIGRPIANTQAYILSPSLEPAPIGAVAELCLGGAGLARGYWRRPEITAERFLPNPYAEAGSRLYRTGDLGRYLADGSVEFLGRKDYQVKVRGFRVELGEIETALREHPAVGDAVVIAREDASHERQLVAYLTPRIDGELEREIIREYLERRLPAYMVPGWILALDKLPLTLNGKVDREALPPPDKLRGQHETEIQAPRSGLEELIATIMAQTLGLERVGSEESFFELGGHSLLATRLISRIRDTLGVEITLRDLFEEPMVAGLARQAEKRFGQQILPPIERAPRGERLLLSYAQQRLWFLDQFAPGNAVYNVPIAVRLNGRLDIKALRLTLAEITRRHEVLRTTFKLDDGGPVQVIGEVAPAILPVIDLSALERCQSQAILKLAREEARRPFDLSSDPMIRSTLLRLGDQEHAVLFTIHHIASDGWSISVLVREVAALYEAYVQNKESSLPELPIQYADYAQWQRAWLRGDVFDTQLSYWKGQLAGSLPALNLATDRPRPSIQTFRGAAESFSIQSELSHNLKALSREQGVTLFMTLLAAFKTLLYRYTGQTDMIIGSPIAGRNRAETEHLIGCFVNTLALRTDLSGNPGFTEVLRRVRSVALGAYMHQDLPFEKLVEELQPERDLGNAPVFQVMFILQNTPSHTLALPGLTLRSIPTDSGAAKFDLTLEISETEQILVGSVGYNTDLFEASTISRMIGSFQTLLESVIADPENEISALRLMTESETVQLLIDWNATAVEYGVEQTLVSLFEAQVERTPDAAALVFDDEQLSYRELNRRANRLARRLQQLGVGPESLVGICLERSLELLIGVLGVLKTGGAYLPLDPSYPFERLAYMLEDSQAGTLLTEERLVEALHLQSMSLAGKRRAIFLRESAESVREDESQNPARALNPEHPAYVIYTSGSTGLPKGVVIPNAAVCNHMLWLRDHFEMTASDRMLQKTPISFDASGLEFYAALFSGGALILAQPGGHRDGAYLVKTVVERQVTILQMVPSLLRMLLQEPGVAQCHSLRRVICAGEALRADLAERFNAILAAELHNFYGPTEASIDVTFWPYDETYDRQVIPIGRPLANSQIYLLSQYIRPVPIGVPGEVHIGGANLARGYLNRPELTADAFMPNPFGAQPGARLYRTGDLARYLPDGNIHFLGRIDQQVKIRGCRIEPEEIESVLSRRQNVREAAVVVHDDPAGGPRLVAYVVCESAEEPTEGELRNYLKSKLPEHMVPSAFVKLEQMPLTVNGKLNRKALPEPKRGASSGSTNYQPPQDEAEEILAALWKETLGLEQLGIDENFFDLGGHSLLVVQIVNRLRGRFAKEITVMDFFRYPTIRSLADFINPSERKGAVQTAANSEPAMRLTQGKLRVQQQLRRRRTSLRK